MWVSAWPFSGEVEPGTTAPRTDSEEWYSSAWFIAVMALVAILILFILLALCLWRTSGNRTVYVRDREPLPPRTKLRSRPPSMSSLYTSSDRKNGSMIVSSFLFCLSRQRCLKSTISRRWSHYPRRRPLKKTGYAYLLTRRVTSHMHASKLGWECFWSNI